MTYSRHFKRRQLFRGSPDRLDSADNHRPGEHGHHGPEQQLVAIELPTADLLHAGINSVRRQLVIQHHGHGVGLSKRRREQAADPG